MRAYEIKGKIAEYVLKESDVQKKEGEKKIGVERNYILD